MMAHVCETSEQYLDHQKYIDRNKVAEKNNVSNTVSYSAVAAADSLNAEAIVTPTVSGFTARLVSKYKPSSLVIATTPDEKVQRKMQILWGVKPLKADRKNSTDGRHGGSMTAKQYLQQAFQMKKKIAAILLLYQNQKQF